MSFSSGFQLDNRGDEDDVVVDCIDGVAIVAEIP